MSQETPPKNPTSEPTPADRRKWLRRALWTVAICAGKWVIFALVIWALAPKGPGPGMTFDAIIVLGAGCNDDGTPGETLEARVGKGVELYKSGRAPILIFTGGPVANEVPESECARKRAIALGVPDTAILTEAHSRNTLGNAREARAITSARSVLIVSSGYHGFRARHLFSKYFDDVGFEPSPHKPLSFVAGLLREPLGVIALLWRQPEPSGKTPAK